MHSLLLLLFLLPLPPKEDTLYLQERVWYEKSTINFFNSCPGTVILTNEAMYFVAENPKRREKYNLILPYDSIYNIRRRMEYIFPNRTLIRMRNGKKHTFFTYEREKMFRIIAAHINRRK